MAQLKQPSLASTMCNVDEFKNFNSKKLIRLINLLVSEAFGTGILIFLLCGTINTMAWKDPTENLVGIALTAGMAVGTAVFCFCHISGPHINPAMSLAAVMLGKISLPMAVLYIIAQCSGSYCAYALSALLMPLGIIFPETDGSYGSRCCSVPSDRLVEWQVVLAEFLGTSILAFAFCSAVDDRNKDKEDSVALKFGMVIVALVIPLAAYSSCSLNPARSFGPAMYNMYWKKHWCFWVGPLLGGAFTGLFYRFVFNPAYMEVKPKLSPVAATGTCPSDRMLGKNKYTTDDEA